MAVKKEIKVEEIDIKDIKKDVGTEKEVETINSGKIEDERKGLSIASLVLGICSIVFMSSFIIAVTCGVLAIVFGLKGRKRAGKGMAAAGFITGIIGVSLQVLFFLFGFFIGLVLGLSLI